MIIKELILVKNHFEYQFCCSKAFAKKSNLAVHTTDLLYDTLDRATSVPSRSRLCAIFKKVDHSCRPQFGFGAGYLSNQDLFSATCFPRFASCLLECTNCRCRTVFNCGLPLLKMAHKLASPSVAWEIQRNSI